MSIPANYDPTKMYVSVNSPQPTYVHSAAGDQFAVWSPVPLGMGDALQVLEDPSQARAKIGQSGQWIQVLDNQGHVGYVDGGKVQEVSISVTSPGTAAPAPASPGGPGINSFAPVAPQPAQPIQPGPGDTVGAGTGIFVHTTLDNGQWIRSAPDLNAATKDDVTTADKMELLGDPTAALASVGKYPQWVQVRSPKGIVGYAAAWYLERYPEYLISPIGHALAGLHGSTETWADRWDAQAFQMIQQGRIEAIKMMASNNLSTQPQLLDSIFAQFSSLSVRFVMARLFAKFETPRTPQDFVNEVTPDAQALYNRGVRYFEVHNEPNLHFVPGNPEGMFVAWQNGGQFGDFFQQAVALLRQTLPDAKFGFPGLSPANEMPKQIYSASTFISEADAAVQSADFVCMHTYWGPGGSQYLSSVDAINAMCKQYPSKLIIVSEFANTDPSTGKDVKGRQYAQFYTQVRTLPPNLGAVFSYAMKSAGNDPDQMWAGSPIAGLVGQRS